MSVQLHHTATKHRRFVLTPWAAQADYDAPTIVRAQGVRLFDDEGRAYIDLSSGLIAVNLGHGHPRVTAAIREQLERVAYISPALFSDVRAELGEALIGLAPWAEGGRVFFTSGGADATEDAVKIARAATGRTKALAAYRSFHGSSAGSSTLTGENRRWGNEPGAPGAIHFFAPFPYRSPFDTRDPQVETARALAHLGEVIAYENPASIAALIIEPVVGSNGAIVYPEGYLAGIRELCTRHGVALIFDEVMTGFGRTGAAFGGARFGVEPDLIAFAKGVTSAYIPLGGVMVRESLAHTFDARPLLAGHTYSGHPIAMAAGLGALAAYRDEGIFERARSLEPRLRAGLEGLAARHPVVGEVRGAGLFFALEFVRDRGTREPLVPWQGAGIGPVATFYAALRKRGAIAFGRYNVALVAPPLTIDEGELDEALVALDGALGEFEAALG
ncbi:MAG: aminotransferase class III-fold pyridoxal phosphate-dependent enzyme [Vulcanimicrobiaceae bacterium]